MIAFFLIGVAAVFPEVKVNVVAITFIVFVVYVVLRSFICMENTDVRNTIVKMIAYTMIAIGGLIGFIFFVKWSFSGY